MVPFGPLVLTPDGSLTCAMYHPGPRQPSRLWVSRNGGQDGTPERVFTGGPGCTSKNALQRCRDGLWLAAARTTAGRLNLYRSEDAGRTWSAPVQGESWSPYRTFISVTGRESDHGDPSSIQLPDSRIVSVYYWGGRADEARYGGRDDLPDSVGLPWHRPCHTGMTHWRADDVFPV